MRGWLAWRGAARHPVAMLQLNVSGVFGVCLCVLFGTHLC